MIRLPCPSCGAEVEFKSRISVFAVCPFCASMLVRSDLKVENFGKMAKLPPDMSVLQLGTTGRFRGVGFELIGRMRMAWVDGFWNEWFALFEDGRQGWLAEAQGQLILSFESDGVGQVGVPPRSNLRAGHDIEIPGAGRFHVDDIKNATCIGSEGELPVSAQKGKRVVSVDLSADSGRFAGITYADDEVSRIYLGSYVEFEELSLENLSEIDGW